MPFYDYGCPECGKVREDVVKHWKSNNPDEKHVITPDYLEPEICDCGSEMERTFNPQSYHLYSGKLHGGGGTTRVGRGGIKTGAKVRERPAGEKSKPA